MLAVSPVRVIVRAVAGTVFTFPLDRVIRYDATGLRADVGRRPPETFADVVAAATVVAGRRGDCVGAGEQPDVVDPPADVGAGLVTLDPEDHPRGLAGERAQVDPAGAVAVAVTAEDLGSRCRRSARRAR